MSQTIVPGGGREILLDLRFNVLERKTRFERIIERGVSVESKQNGEFILGNSSSKEAIRSFVESFSTRDGWSMGDDMIGMEI